MGLRSVTVGTSTSFSSSSPTVLYSDSNWGLQIGYSTNQVYWRSRLESGAGEEATGRLDYGNFQLKSKLVLPVAGGGATNGSLKTLKLIRVSDNVVLVSYTLSQLLGSTNSDLLKIASLDTNSWYGMEVYLSFVDNDAGMSWAWFGVDLANIYCY